MDVEHLSKSQIVLLVILCTFVTSIATAIVTVALLAQAPPAVPQTINHIIQRTVEAVTPLEPSTTTTIKETTVVVKEEEVLSKTISSVFGKLASIHEGTGTTTTVVGLGIFIGDYLITDSAVVGERAVTFGDTIVQYEVVDTISEVGVALMKPVEGKVPSSIRIADATALRLGQSVIALPSHTGSRVGIGALTARYSLARIGEDETPIRAIETNMSGSMLPGTPLFTALGDVIGISTGISRGPSGGQGTFVALSDLAPFLLDVRGTSTPAVLETDPQ